MASDPDAALRAVLTDDPLVMHALSLACRLAEASGITDERKGDELVDLLHATAVHVLEDHPDLPYPEPVIATWLSAWVHEMRFGTWPSVALDVALPEGRPN